VGIVPVHLYGHCADMKAVSTIAKKHKLWVVEDNAQSIDAHGDGFKQGELSDAVCTSFIIQKTLVPTATAAPSLPIVPTSNRPRAACVTTAL